MHGTEGTYHFFAPEMCSSGYLGHDGRKADVWAAGVCFWAFLLGTLPFLQEEPGGRFCGGGGVLVENHRFVWKTWTATNKEREFLLHVQDKLWLPEASNAQNQDLATLMDDIAFGEVPFQRGWAFLGRLLEVFMDFEMKKIEKTYVCCLSLLFGWGQGAVCSHFA